MATPSSIGLVNNNIVIQQLNTTDIISESGAAAIGEVVQIYAGCLTVEVGSIVLYKTANVYRFSQSTDNFAALADTEILLIYTPLP